MHPCSEETIAPDHDGCCRTDCNGGGKCTSGQLDIAILDIAIHECGSIDHGSEGPIDLEIAALNYDARRSANRVNSEDAGARGLRGHVHGKIVHVKPVRGSA